MTTRPIFIPSLEDRDTHVQTLIVEFHWYPGFAVSQKQKSIDALHNSLKKTHENCKVLEISSKSKDYLGVRLSAFNLMIEDKGSGMNYSVENAFQAGKVFSNGGPFTDLLRASSLEAKRDSRLSTSGDLIHFTRNDIVWELYPKTMFYDWIYLNALATNKKLASEVLTYQAFSDIEFNPKKSINCQAYSVALFVALTKKEMIDKALSSPAVFKEMMKNSVINNSHEDQLMQPELML